MSPNKSIVVYFMRHSDSEIVLQKIKKTGRAEI